MLLSDPVTTIPYIGKSYAQRLKKLDIKTVEDLLHHYPSRYDDFSKSKKIDELIAGETVTVAAQVLDIKAIYTGGGKKLTRATVADETGELLVVWFNPYVTKNIKKGDRVNLSGSLGKSGSQPAFVSPEYEVVASFYSAPAGEEKSEALTEKEPRSEKPLGSIHTGRLVPIYPETRGITSRWLRSRINATLHTLKIPKTPPSVNVVNGLAIDKLEHLPPSTRQSQNLVGLKEALRMIHFPNNQGEINKARKRLGFDELFLMQIKALKRRAEWQKKPLANKFSISNFQFSIEEFIKSLPFELTNAQKRAVDEILKDLEKNVPMNRLLEGDVGSGKTVVAAAAIYATHLNGFQSALMAPTEVLAEQHFRTISELLKPFGVNVKLRTGSRKGIGDRGEGIGTRKGKYSLNPKPNTLNPGVWIGTHALLFDSVKFENLGLVIIDEQHRFGVKQRAKLLKKVTDDKTPHLLTMTATPIPRSLALTAYGDLDLSVLDEMPPGRKEVITWVVPNRKRQAAYEWIREQIIARRGTNEKATVKTTQDNLKESVVAGTLSADGRERLSAEKPSARAVEGAPRGPAQTQAFIICPLIEESEAETMQSVKAAAAEYERLSKKVFPDLRLALLHGKVRPKEKNKILEDYKSGKYDILVSTQVVEVGIDVPTATLMIIEGAERFGLASLHQLRGRVGRSDRQSYCLLFTSSRNRKAYSRLKAMEEINDGFKLAEVDLKMRGPGEIYGVKQHGIKEFKIASLSDVKLIETTRSEAKKLLEENPNLSKHPNLKEKIDRMSSELVEPN